MSAQGYIVIVEPDDLIRELLERWLGEAGYGVVLSAKDHDKSMVIPQLVIADISDPGSAGATIGALRAAYSAPILALSGALPARPRWFQRGGAALACRESLAETVHARRVARRGPRSRGGAVTHRFVAKLEGSAFFRYALAPACIAIAVLLHLSVIGPFSSSDRAVPGCDCRRSMVRSARAQDSSRRCSPRSRCLS